MKKLILLIIPLIFFVSNLVTISDYNVNWDEPEHYMRGQAYLRYIFTGERSYNSLPLFAEFSNYLQHRNEPTVPLPRYSIYQSGALDASYFLEKDYGHPPLNDILAAATNYIFYQKLGWLGDIEAYHFFIIVISTLLVFLVGFWAMEEYGFYASLISMITITFYPIFIAESHNNIKDTVEATFYAYTLYAFYKAYKHKMWQWIIISAVFFGLALGTKLNVIFLPAILFVWLTIVNFSNLRKKKLSFTLGLTPPMLKALLVYPIISIIIVYIAWPRLWADPVTSLLKTFNYYKDIGTDIASQPGFHFYGFNTYPMTWIAYTTPIIVLVLLIWGTVCVYRLQRNESNKPSLLWFIWFSIPILRVTMPGASIYGGVRQIMEYVPALSLLSGIGATAIITSAKNHVVRGLLCVCMLALFVPTLFTLRALHPNENLYFNSIAGGLPGVVARDFPGWGTTLGNPYLQGVNWLNEHAEPNATLIITLGVMTNIPSIKLRSDITYANNLESLTARKGEYIMDLTYHALPPPYYDAQYPERFLVPIHEVMVDGIPILRIWKNDEAHTKSGYINEGDISQWAKIQQNEIYVDITLSKEVYLTKMNYYFNPKNCDSKKDGRILTSLNGKKWIHESETLLADQIPSVKKTMSDGTITHFLAAVSARYIRIEAETFSCLLQNPRLQLFGLRDIFPSAF